MTCRPPLKVLVRGVDPLRHEVSPRSNCRENVGPVVAGLAAAGTRAGAFARVTCTPLRDHGPVGTVTALAGLLLPAPLPLMTKRQAPDALGVLQASLVLCRR
jgi:hypothetical protein